MTAVRSLFGADLLAAIALAWASGATSAQVLRDPMQPPAAMTATAPAGNAGEPATSEPPLALQSVLITADRRHAWISDRAVQVGDRLGRQRVARIEDSGVTLVDPAGKRTVLALHPDVIRRTDAIDPTATTRAVRAGATR